MDASRATAEPLLAASGKSSLNFEAGEAETWGKTHHAHKPRKDRCGSALPYALVVLALAVNIGLIAGGLRMIGNSYAANSSNILYATATAGSAILFAGIAAGPLAFGLAAYYIAIHNRVSSTVKAVILGLFTGLSIFGSAYAGAQELQVSATFDNTNPPDNYRQYLGAFIMLVYAFVGAASLALFIRLLCAPCSCRRGAEAGRERPIQPYGLRHNWLGVVTLCVVFALSWFCTSFLTPMWNFSAHSYFATPSPMSLVQAQWTFNINYTALYPSSTDSYATPAIIYIKLYSDVCVYFTVILALALLGMGGAAIPSCRRVLHRRVGWLTIPAKAISAAPRGLSWLLSFFNLFPVGATIGEVFTVTTFVVLFGYWIHYWGYQYPRLYYANPGNEASNMLDNYPRTHLGARVLGHLTTLTMSFLVYPVARNSVWESVFGIPFERAIKYHRVLGRLSWILVTLHMLLWQVKWALEGTVSIPVPCGSPAAPANQTYQSVNVLLNNIVTTDCLIISGTDLQDQDGDPIHNDNFTIPLAELGWLVLTLSLIPAAFMRRSKYIIFQYAHNAVWFYFAMALIHAWSHWYYMIGGLTLYALDKCARLVSSTRRARLLRIAHEGGVTQLVFDGSLFDSCGGHYAGQYAFINIPSIGLLEWHPFSISSAPQAAASGGVSSSADRVVTFHIKDMGPEKWTCRLTQVAANTPNPSDLLVGVDGPYGRSGHYADKDVVLLVAGGIGITPLHSILVDLHCRMTNPKVFGTAGRVKRVHLVWIVREPAMLLHFADTLASVASNNLGGAFTIQLCCTANSGGGRKGAAALTNGPVVVGNPLAGNASAYSASASGAATIPPSTAGVCFPASASALEPLITHGRPNLAATFAELASQAAGLPGAAATPDERLVAMVCGPQALIGEVSDLAFAHGTDFHSEVFNF